MNGLFIYFSGLRAGCSVLYLNTICVPFYLNSVILFYCFTTCESFIFCNPETTRTESREGDRTDAKGDGLGEGLEASGSVAKMESSGSSSRFSHP